MTATAYIKEGEESMVINGRKLTEGTYQFYYENEESISQKMALVNKYQLKGLAAWSLGQETKEVWQEYARFLSNLPEEKEEIQEAHWAKDAIDYVQEKGWMLGRENHVFAPNAYLTRAELTMIMTRILCLQVDNMLEEIGYLDVSLHWARNAINAVTKTGLMEGYENGYFYPEKIITREEVAKVLSFLVKEQKIEKNIVFTDVKQERWSYSYIQKMVKNGIFNGYEDDTFRPQQGITRAEMAMLLMRLNLEEV